jgi:hypothetical protein
MSRRQLYHGQPGASSAAVYTSDNQCTTITGATVQNTTGGAVTLDAWIVPTGGSAVDATLIFEGLSIAANAVAGLDKLVAHTIPKDGELHLAASAATSLTVYVSGDQHS